MDIAPIKDNYEMLIDTLEGSYGWVSEIIAIFAIVILCNFGLKWLLQRLHIRYESQKKIWKDSFVTALFKPLSYFIWFFALFQIADLISYTFFKTTLLDNKHQLYAVFAIVCLAWFLFRWKSNITTYLIYKSKNHEIALDRGRIDVINKVVTIAIVFISLLLVMEATNMSMNTLIAFGGVGGLAIAFASQEIIANFFGGLMIYITQPFMVGDWIVLPEKNIEGNVEDIGWYMTRIRNFEKRPIYVPNAIFTKMIVHTPERMTHRRFSENIGLRYSDMAVIKSVMRDIKEMLINHSDIDHSFSANVFFTTFGQTSLDINISAYTPITNGDRFNEFRQELLLKIYQIIKDNGAEIATPITYIELVKDAQPLQLPG